MCREGICSLLHFADGPCFAPRDRLVAPSGEKCSFVSCSLRSYRRNTVFFILSRSDLPPTWEEPLTPLHGVVAHTVVSAGEDDSLLIEETQVVPHTCPESEDKVGLCNSSSHY